MIGKAKRGEVDNVLLEYPAFMLLSLPVILSLLFSLPSSRLLTPLLAIYMYLTILMHKEALRLQAQGDRVIIPIFVASLYPSQPIQKRKRRKKKNKEEKE